MPSVEQNLAMWNPDWGHDGSPWSERWGNVPAQWYGCIYPRIARYLPTKRILEIAPGYGRWTQYLLKHCDVLHGVDISETALAECQRKFGGFWRRPKTRFVRNDGRSLSAFAGNRYGFVFSFDSLVHVDLDVLSDYIKQIIPMLDKRGVCFIHHSNLGEYGPNAPNPGFRSHSVTGEAVEALIDKFGGRMLVQEKLVWNPNETMLRDCFTLFGRISDFAGIYPKRIRSADFTTQSRLIKESIALYHEQGVTGRPAGSG